MLVDGPLRSGPSAGITILALLRVTFERYENQSLGHMKFLPTDNLIV